VNTSRSGRPTALERALDKAIAIPASRIEVRVARMRRDRPGADAAELVEMAGARFRRDAGLSSGAVGASAAIPAISTGVAAALTVGQSAAFIASAVTYVLTVAEIQGVHVVDTERRRALVLSALLGKEGSEAVQGQLGLSSMFWAAQLLMQMPLPSVKSINAHLIKRVAKRSAAKGGALALGRLLPFGIGAAIGWKGGRALANQVIEGAQAAPGGGDAVGQHLEDEGGHAELEPGDGVEAVGVACHQVETAPALGVGVGLVAGVDQGAVHRGAQADDLLQVVGPLTDLEVGALADSAGADPARAHQERADHEQGDQGLNEVVEVEGAGHEVVLVGAVGGALAVDVVLEQSRLHASKAEPLGSHAH